MTTARARREYGTGSVYPIDGGARWRAKVPVGFYANGTPRALTRTRKTRALALVALKDLRRQIDAEGALGGVSERASVKTWAGQWLDIHVRAVRPKTYATDASAVRRWIIPTIGHRPVSAVTPADVRALTRAILDAGLSPSTAHRATGVLRTMLVAAQAEGHRVPARVLAVKRPMPAETERDAMTRPDLLAVLRAASEHPDGSRWLLALYHGMRPAEVLGLTWDAVDFTAATLDVSWQLQALPYRQTDDPARGFRLPDDYQTRHLTGAFHLVRPKTAKGRRLIPSPAFVLASLARWYAVAPPNPWGLIYAATDDRHGRTRATVRSPERDRAAWHALLASAGVTRRYTLYEARHTFATLLLQVGAGERASLDLMGHSKITTTHGYQHVDTEHSRAALEAVAALLAQG